MTPHKSLTQNTRLAALARCPQTAAVYDARAALAALYVSRAFNRALLASGIKRDRSPMRWMSAVGFRHMPEVSR